MRIHIGLVTYALDVTPLVDSFDPRGHDDPESDCIIWHIFQHSTNPEVNAAIDLLHKNHRVRVHPERTNRGLARSWNQFLIDAQMMKADAMLIVNDDITGTHGDILKMAQACVDHPEVGIFVATGYNRRMGQRLDLGFSFFAVNPIAIQQIGYFDQNFTPIYFEDTDYSRRAALLGVQFLNIGETSLDHVGTATINKDPKLFVQNDKTFQANKAYYKEKWGGDPGDEDYMFPFDAGMYNLRIAEEERNNPYPGYERRDLEGLIKI